MNTPQHHTNNFDHRLQRLFAETRRRALGYGLLRFCAAGGLILLAAVWALGGDIGPGAFNGWGLSLSLLVGLLILGWHLVLKPWRALATPAQLAARIEQEANFDNVVFAAEEAGRCPDRWPDDVPVAAELKQRLLARAADVLTLVAPADILPMRYVRTSWFGLALGMMLGVLAMIAVPSEMSRGWGRLVRPAPANALVLTGGLYAAADLDQVVVGQNVDLVGFDFAAGVEQAVTEIRVGGGTWQPLSTRKVALTETPLGLPDPYRRWQATATEVREDFSWRLRRGTLVSAEREVTVHHYPLLTSLSATVVPPQYTRLPNRNLDRLPSWIEVPAGSRLALQGRVSHVVESAVLVFDDGDTVTLAVDSLSVQGSLDVAVDRRFVVALVDGYGLGNHSPLVYEVAAAIDAPPGVSLMRPDDDGILPLNAEVSLECEAVDDFGISALRLLARIGAVVPLGQEAGNQWVGGEIWNPGAAAGDFDVWREVPTAAGPLQVRVVPVLDEESHLRTRLSLELRAEGLGLVAGDGLELLVEAVDNKRPRPAGVTRSQTVRLRLPSVGDVLLTQVEANDDRKSELEEMRLRSSELNADLDRLTRELMKNPMPDWARQKEMEAAISRQQKLQDELARVADQLKNELEKLGQSQLASESQLRKADEMSELLSQNNSDSLNDLLEKMEAGGGQASPEDVARAMDEVARNQQDMARRLDAALSMLKRMAQEQELDGLTDLLEQMIQKQQELADLSRELAEKQEKQTEQSDPSDSSDPSDQAGDESGDQAEAGSRPESSEQSETDPTAEELARRQEALEEELAQLQEKLEEALENLRQENAEDPRESSEEMAEALEKALDQVKKQQQKDSMGKASDELKEMDPQKAAEMQEQALRDLGSLYSVLLKSRQSMQQAMEMEQVSSLRGLAADMLALSARQEIISQKIPPQMRDLRALDLTRGQHRLQKAAVGVRSSLSELMDEAPNRILKLMTQVDALIETMGESLLAMEENRAPVARRHTQESLSQTNRFVIGLLTEAQMQGSGSGGGGGSGGEPSLAEKLQQMAQEQAEMNGVTEELRRMLADRGISQQSRSEMKRLGEQQAEMAARMGELAEEERLQPEGDRLLGDLSELGRNMESIGQEIDDGLVSEETLVRQERILSRMLDARNSVRRRDFSNRRESETASRLYNEQNGGTVRDPAESNNPFRLKYQPLAEAPLEYRDLVRRYFSALDSLGQAAPGASLEGDLP